MKLVVAGGFGVGKTIFVKGFRKFAADHREEMTVASEAWMTSGLSARKRQRSPWTSGRITISEDRGTVWARAEPFWPLWNDLALGAVGAVVLVDAQREDGFACVDFFERRGIPFIVAVNCFDDAYRQPEEACKRWSSRRLCCAMPGSANRPRTRLTWFGTP